MKKRFYNFDNLELTASEKMQAIKKTALKNPNPGKQAIAEFSRKFKREVQFCLMKGLTVLQILDLQRLIRKLPFESRLIQFNPLSQASGSSNSNDGQQQQLSL